MKTEKIKEYFRIVRSYKTFKVPLKEQREMNEALYDTNWDWYEDCDGCTGVSEPGWPTKYYPPCVRHDYDWFMGNNMIEAQTRFYRFNRLYGMGVARSVVRWIGTYIFWIAFGWPRKILSGSPVDFIKRKVK